jgi:hypothetical protein
MAIQLHEVEFETRTIGPLVLTVPVLRRLGFREIVNRLPAVGLPQDHSTAQCESKPHVLSQTR